MDAVIRTNGEQQLLYVDLDQRQSEDTAGSSLLYLEEV
jgi:hypothetical protein